MKLAILVLSLCTVAFAQYVLPTPVAEEVIGVSNEYLAPAAEEATVFADDGYRYKTVHRYRKRRDVSELVSGQYLPPTQESYQSFGVAAPTNEYLAPAVGQSAVLADDGYRYKTVRRFRNRNRREVSGEYLPPIQESYQSIGIPAPTNEYLAPAVGESAVLANDGYRYKTVRRFRNRNRREVSGEYLPPIQESYQSIGIPAPTNEYLAPAVGESAVLANDGYRYKTVRRFRNRNRREVSGEYLPPTQESYQSFAVAAPTNEYLAPAIGESAVLADDGYRYKTVRRFRNRNRRDVSELLGAQYLPPHQETFQSFEVAAPANDYLAPAAEGATILANDGYRYKTVRKYKTRRH